MASEQEPTSAEEFLERQSALQREAQLVAEDLGLTALLSSVGDPIRVGSAALGLMVWRDLDITVVCPTLVLDPVVGLATAFARHPKVWQVEFRNDTERWNTDPAYPDGLYIGLRYRSDNAHDWKLDLWFVDEPDRQPDLMHMQTLPSRLDAETRLAILVIKTEWRQRPDYGTTVTSYDIYRAVLDDGVRSSQDFEHWQEQQP